LEKNRKSALKTLKIAVFEAFLFLAALFDHLIIFSDFLSFPLHFYPKHDTWYDTLTLTINNLSKTRILSQMAGNIEDV